MENSTLKAAPQEVETQEKTTGPTWRSDERRTDNRILSALVRNAQRKNRAKSAAKPPEGEVNKA